MAFACSRASRDESDSMYSWHVLWLTTMFLRSRHASTWISSVLHWICTLLGRAVSVPPCGCTTSCWSRVLLLKFSHFQPSAIINKAVVRYLHKPLCGHVFSLLLVKYLGVEWLGYRISICVSLHKALPNHFPKWLHAYIPSSKVQEF